MNPRGKFELTNCLRVVVALVAFAVVVAVVVVVVVVDARALQI